MKNSYSARFVTFLACMLSLAGVVAVHAAVLPHDLKIEKVLSSTAEVGDLEQAPNGELWVLERTTGTIRVLVEGVEATSLTVPVKSDCDSGMLSVAFAPDYVSSGLAFVYYVNPAGDARVDQILRSPSGLQLGTNILNLGVPASGCRPGGGMDVGTDGKLYVVVGDMGAGGDAQLDTPLAGKVLRVNLDGSPAGDNLSGTERWARGFRNGSDLTIGSGGQVYLTDAGEPVNASDEVNEVKQDGNHGWSLAHGNTGGTFDDPLVAVLPPVNYRSLALVDDGNLGSAMQDSLVYACDESATDEIRQAFLTGAGLDQLAGEATMYDPDGDTDGTPDAGCPKQFSAITEGKDGWIYGANYGDNPGVWRIWHDTPGAREVSAPGSPFPLTVDTLGSNLVIGWENLGTLDVGRPPRNAGQRQTVYQIFEGSLPIVAGSYDHTVLTDTDGTENGLVRLSEEITPSAGSRYYLVAAQADNYEGTLGAASDSTPRPGTLDYCDTIGYGIAPGVCARGWVNPIAPTEELKLIDYNPNSATYLQALGISDFRGKVVKFDISALNCVFCNAMADVHPSVDAAYEARDLRIVTIMTDDFTQLNPIAPGSCAAALANWASTHGESSPLLCDVDMDNDGFGDVTVQYWDGPGCGGTPQNIYVDQGNVIYSRICGGQLSFASISGVVVDEVNKETCE